MTATAGSRSGPLDVVVTGCGVVCATASSADGFAEALRSAQVGLGATDLPDSERTWLAGRIREPLPAVTAVWPSLEVNSHERLAIVAAREALASAELRPDDRGGLVVGVYVAACQGGMHAYGEGGSPSRGGDVAVQQSLRSIADTVAVALDVHGPRVVTSNACSASASAIAVAAEELVADRVDVAVAGGSDALERFTLEGFGSLASLDEQGCSPYHRSSGLVVGEGAGFVVLERGERAGRRGAPCRGRLLGWGASADAYHPTAPDPTGRGAATAVARALAMAACAVDDIDYVNGHGTGTHANDSMELRAFSSVFASCGQPPPVSSTKSMIGHTLGAASVIESIATLLGMEGGFLPPTASGGAEPLVPIGCRPLDVITDRATRRRTSRSVKTSYAFGGANYALVWGAKAVPAPAETSAPGSISPAGAKAVVTGVGVLGPAGSTLDGWSNVLLAGTSPLRPVRARLADAAVRPVLVGLCPDIDQAAPTSANAWRRMDRLSRRCVLVAHSAWADAGLASVSASREAVMILLATASGPVSTLLEYRARMVKGDQRGMASLFPNTALNAAAGHVATSMGLRGGIASFTSGGLTSDLALRHAADLVEHGRYRQVLVIAAEELTRELVEVVAGSDVVPLATSHVRPFDGERPGTALSEAAVCLVVESADAALDRGARVYGTYLGSGLSTGPDEVDKGAWHAAYDAALAGCGASADDVDVVYAAASGLGRLDNVELAAIESSFGTGTEVSVIRSLLGNSLGANGAVSSVVALLAFGLGRTPALWRERGQMPRPAGSHTRIALVNSVSMAGQCFSTAWASSEGGPTP